jgi:hypothetical protein
MPIESRRSRKQREVVYQNGIQSNVLREISTPRQDGTIPLISFIENANYSILELYDFKSRMQVLEENQSNFEFATKDDLSKLYEKIADTEEIQELKNELTEIKELEPKMEKSMQEVKKEITMLKWLEPKMENSIQMVKNNILELTKNRPDDNFMEITKMENDISNQYFSLHMQLEKYISETQKLIYDNKTSSVRVFVDQLKKRVQTKVIPFDELMEQNRVDFKKFMKEIYKKTKDEFSKAIKLVKDMSDALERRNDHETKHIEVKMKKESFFNTIFIDLKNKYKITQLSLQTLYINIFSETSSICSCIFGKIETLLREGSMSDVQLILHIDDYANELITNIEEDENMFDLDITIDNKNRDEHEFAMFKKSKKPQERASLVNKTV